MSAPIVHDLESIQKLIAASPYKIFGVGGNPATRAEAWPFVPGLEIISANKTGEYDSVVRKVKVKTYQKLKSPVPFAIKKPETILKDPEVVDYIKANSQGKTVALYLYKGSADTEKIAAKHGWKVVANRSYLFDRLDDKIYFIDLLKRINHPSTKTIHSMKLSQFEDQAQTLFDELGDRIVIQLPNEGGGKGTFFFTKDQRSQVVETIKNRLGIIKKESGDIDIMVNRFVEGPSVSITGCITRDNGILTSYAQYQLIDISEAIQGKKDGQGVFCGHDWVLSNEIPMEIHEKASRLAEKIGGALKEEGALGIFGLDLIWDKASNDLVPLEINPRLLGTFPCAVEVQLAKGEVPLVAFHILDFLDIAYKIEDPNIYKRDLARPGAHIIIFNPYPYAVTCGRELKGGVYKLSGDQMEFVRPGFELEDIDGDGEFVLTDGVPVQEIVYGANRKIVKIITRQSIAKDGGTALNEWGKRVVETVISSFNLKKYEREEKSGHLFAGQRIFTW